MTYFALPLVLVPFDLETRLVECLEVQSEHTASIDTLFDLVLAWCDQREIELRPERWMVESYLHRSRRFVEVEPGTFGLA
jgi:hypothetical protein